MKTSDDLFRIAAVDRDAINREERTIDLVLATEAPIPTADLSRMEIVEEVLRLDGMELPKQIPMVDSHQRESVHHVLGSMRNLRVERGPDGPRLLARAYFAKDPVAMQAFNNYADGHLTDFSVGAARLQSRYEPGNRKIVERSRLIEGSAVVRGGDPSAKALPATLRAYMDPHGVLEEAMLTQLKEKLIARGMPKDADDKAAIEFLDKELSRAGTDGADTAGLLKDVRDALTRSLPTAAGEKAITDLQQKHDELVRKLADADNETKRVGEIDRLCQQHGIEDEVRRKYVADKKSIEDVAKDVLERMAQAGAPLGAMSYGQSDKEKFYGACRDSLVQRAVMGGGVKPHAALERAKAHGDADAIERSQELVRTFEKPSDGTRELRNIGMLEMARMFCERSGIRTMGMPNQTIVSRALGVEDFVRRSSDGPAYNTTGSFANLMLDAANKTLLAAYDEAAVTYPMWVRTAPSAADFKALNRIRFGELSDPEVVPENHEYPEKTTSDARESYKVEKYGEMFSISLEAIVNDDLNAISRIPAMQGNAMRRKINKVVYAVLTDNAALSDGVALFHSSSHNANLDATALSSTALNVGFVVMMTQAGLTSGTILNIMPKYLIVPPALAATAYILTASMTDPSNTAASTEDASRPNYATGVPNQYGPGGPRSLTTVVEGQLSASQSATLWFLAADPSQVDTIELTFLRGEESPVLERENGFTTDTVKYKIRQTFAAKAIDYRGLYQGNA